MSDVSGGLVKLAYRGIVGFILVILLFTFGIVGIALSFVGGLAIALCWLPLAFPDLLNNIDVIIIAGQPTNDPLIVTIGFFIAGCILLLFGFVLIFITYWMAKTALIIDQEVSDVIDRVFSSQKNRVSQLERLANLYERGLLSDQEFQAEKSRILGNDGTFKK